MSEIPSVKVLEAIKPANSGTGEEVLAYNGLAQAVEKYRPTNPARSAEFWDSEEGSLEELSKAKQLASEYFLRTADKVVSSHEGNRDLWADRFTQATVELYGEPEKEEVARLVRSEYGFLSHLQGQEGISQQHVNYLLDVYKPMLTENTDVETDESAVEKEKEAIHEYGEPMLAKYKPLFDLVDETGKTEFTARAVTANDQKLSRYFLRSK